MPPHQPSLWSVTKSPARLAPGAAHPHCRPVTQWPGVVAERAAALPPPLEAGELDALRAAHEAWGADAATLENLAHLGRPTARVVVAGQQPGLLAGPLLVLYKALAAVRLARAVQAQHPELHVVPVFWLASEDHDFDEIKRLHWPAAAGSLELALLPPESHQPGAMIGGLATAPFWEPLREQLGATLGPTEFSPAVLAELEAALGAPGATLEAATARLLLRLTRGLGLVLVTPGQPWLRRRAAALLAHDFAHAGAFAARLNARGAELAAQFGMPPPLARQPGALNAFWLDAAGLRHTLRLDAAGQVRRALPGREPELPPWSPAELQAELAAHPGRFSCNAVTRPLLQDAVLPTLAQVVGPGEAAYLAQVECLYAEFGVFAPVRHPRPEVVLLEPRVARALEKYQLTIEEALGADAPALADLALTRTLAGSDELHALGGLEARHRRELAELRARLADGDLRAELKPDPAIAGAFEKLDGMLEKGYATLRERILYKRRQSEGHLQRAVALVANTLRPKAQPQERVLNPLVPFAWQHGLEWPRALLERLDVAPDAPLQAIALGTLHP